METTKKNPMRGDARDRIADPHGTALDGNELVYPGEGSPFAFSPVGGGPTAGPYHTGPPAHPAEPWTEVPRFKVHPGTALTSALLQSLTECATACERCIAACKGVTEPHRLAETIAVAKACSDTCVLLHSFASSGNCAMILHMAMDLSPVCARICEACALECSKQSAMPDCVVCETACRTCAENCRFFSN